MNVALALDETLLTDKLNRVIELAPCTVSGGIVRHSEEPELLPLLRIVPPKPLEAEGAASASN